MKCLSGPSSGMYIARTGLEPTVVTRKAMREARSTSPFLFISDDTSSSKVSDP